MTLVLASTWAAREFDPACVPDKRTIARWVREGHVPGRVISKCVYVDSEKWAAKKSSTGDALADTILEKLR